MVTCPLCGLSAERSEFIALAAGSHGSVSLHHRDAAPAESALVCVGCASSLGASRPDVLRDAVLRLVAAS